MLNAKYVNPTMDRDLEVKITRAKYVNTGNEKEIEYKLEASNKGVKYSGKVAVKMSPNKPYNMVVEVNKGSQKMLQLQVQVKTTGRDFTMRGKYVLLGIERGTFGAVHEANVLTLKTGLYKLTIDLDLGRSIKVKAEKDGVTMWSYKTLREDKSSESDFLYEIYSEMMLNPASKLHSALEAFYPFGAFTKRSNKIKIFVDNS